MRVKSESGQATTEYVLLLIVMVAIILALITQFFKPMQNFLSSYMGDYTACLLQTGELPSFGGESSIASEEGCSAKFEPGTLANGRPPLDPATNSGSNKGKDGSGNESGGGGGGGSSASSRGGSSSRVLSSSRRSTQSGDVAATASKTTEIATNGAGSGSFFTTNSSGTIVIRRSKSTVLSSRQYSEEVKKALAKRQEGGRRVISSESTGTPPKKVSIKIPEKIERAPAEEAEFTLGNFMRMLFIIGIILAIVIFVGGQVLQMSKNGDN